MARGSVYHYIASIRNREKQDYARRYWSYLQSGSSGSEPDRGALSVMGAQAVRIRLHEFHAKWGNPMRHNPARHNPTYQRYGGREGSAEFRHMTLEEAKMLNYGEHIWFLATDGTARRVKVNGRPQLWKRSPGKVRVPVKYGMYETGQFYEHDFGPSGRVLVPV